ncbi:MAG: LysM peptidoglycan-binding domain-containing protein [Coprobacillaceae bacterium]
MNTTQITTHIVQPGDYPYQLAKQYNTTVDAIMALNPNINPHDLVVGTRIFIPVGVQPEQPKPSMDAKRDLMAAMRLAWEQHVYWTRLLLISIADRLGDQQATTNRLLENPYDIAKIFSNYYSTEVTNTIANLLTTHLQIGAALITALRDGNTTEANRLNQLWYQNADQMALTFSQINPNYGYQEMKDMLDRHLDLTTQEVNMRLAKNYIEDINAFDIVEQEALHMADMFSTGIIRQFPNRF